MPPTRVGGVARLVGTAGPDDEAIMAEDETDEGGGALRKILLLLAVLAAGSYVLKRQREMELDEALWEEPRAL